MSTLTIFQALQKGFDCAAALVKSDWDEEKHPRGEHGHFSGNRKQQGNPNAARQPRAKRGFAPINIGETANDAATHTQAMEAHKNAAEQAEYSDVRTAHLLAANLHNEAAWKHKVVFQHGKVKTFQRDYAAAKEASEKARAASASVINTYIRTIPLKTRQSRAGDEYTQEYARQRRRDKKKN